MNKEEIKLVAQELRNAIARANQMWDEKEASHAFIVGYLEGSMKAVASFLENK
jgi:hypothetical protein